MQNWGCLILQQEFSYNRQAVSNQRSYLSGGSFLREAVHPLYSKSDQIRQTLPWCRVADLAPSLHQSYAVVHETAGRRYHSTFALPWFCYIEISVNLSSVCWSSPKQGSPTGFTAVEMVKKSQVHAGSERYKEVQCGSVSGHTFYISLSIRRYSDTVGSSNQFHYECIARQAPAVR